MKKSGFTLIELIFVIVIIGLLAAVAVPKFLTTKKSAETANIPEVANQIVTKATEQYELTGENNLSKIIEISPDINKYLTDLSNNNANFKNASTETEFNITYGPNNNVCLLVERNDTVPVVVRGGKEINTTEFQITKVDLTCNTN
jgi:prepilin-type N-terminal cleavage/methylation domain-containing protein